MADGSQHSVAIIAESTYGQTPTTPAFKAVRNTSCTLGVRKGEFQSQQLRQDRQITDLRHGNKSVSGDIGAEVSYGSFDDVFEALLGGTWAADTPAVGTDQLKAGTTRRSFTIERFFADLQPSQKPYHRHSGCEFNTLGLSVPTEGIVTATLGVIGKGLVFDTVIVTGATYGAETTTSPFDGFTGALSEGGSTIAIITEISLNLDNGMAARHVLGDDETIRPSIGRSNLTGQFTAYFEDSVLYEKFVNETESSLDFTLTDGATSSLKMIIPRLKYKGGAPDVTGEGPIIQTLPFQALLDGTENTNIIIERTPV